MINRATNSAIVLVAGLALAACGTSERAIRDQAENLAQRHLIVDTHIDAPIWLRNENVDLGAPTPARQFDFPRARTGGLDVAFMSIYTPASAALDGTSRQLADTQIDRMEHLATTQPSKFAIATCTADVDHLRDSGVVMLALGMENGSPLAAASTDTAQQAGAQQAGAEQAGAEQAEAEQAEAQQAAALLDHFVRRGIRYVTLAHSKANEYADSSYDENERWQGLSAAGEALVAELNERGVMIDISHLTDKAAWRVLELSEAPVIASHSSLRHFIPGFHRNMSDDMVKAVAAGGGVVQINFGSGFVAEAARDWSNRLTAALAEQFGDAPPDVATRRSFSEAFRSENPYPFATVDAVLDHIDRTVALAGIDYVGLGSDFDGVGDTLPIGLKDVAAFPNLIEGLLQRDYDEEMIAKVLGLNLMRVWRQVEDRASPGHEPMCGHA